METDAPSFDWVTLDEGESVVWTGQPHRYSIVPALVVGIPLCLVLVGVPIVVGAYLHRENTEYVVTTEALYVKRGVLSRDVRRVGLEKVQDTAYEQDYLRTKLGYGSVEISTAAGTAGELTFRNVGDPVAVQTHINRQLRSAGGARNREEKAAVLDDVLAELRAIRRAVEDGEGAGTATDPDRVPATADGSAPDDGPPDTRDGEP